MCCLIGFSAIPISNHCVGSRSKPGRNSAFTYIRDSFLEYLLDDGINGFNVVSLLADK